MSLGRPVKAEPGAKVVRTCIPLVCGPGCGLLAHVKDGVLVKVEPGDFPGTSHICARCLSAVKWVYHPDRLKYPMKRQGARGEGRWQRISWDEALDTIVHRLREISDRHGSRSVAWTMDFMALLATDALEGFIGAYQGTFLLPSGYTEIQAVPVMVRSALGPPPMSSLPRIGWRDKRNLERHTGLLQGSLAPNGEAAIREDY